MKFPALVLATLLLLCGCAAQPQEPAAPPATTPPPVTLPEDIYDAHSKIEKITDGAVKAYPLDSASVAAAPMGQDIVVFSGSENTVLAVYSGSLLRMSATLELECAVSVSDPAVLVSQRGITFFNAARGELVFLDTHLEETGRVTLPETLCGSPALSADLQKIYYCTASSLRCTDLQTGLDRLIRQMDFESQSVAQLHCSDAVIVCDTEDTQGQFRRLYISAETGQLLYEDGGDVTLYTEGSSYFAAHKDGIYTELLIGSSEHGPTLLTPCTYQPAAFALLPQSSAVTVSQSAFGTVQLDRYDLRSGKRTACVSFSGVETLGSFFALDETSVWFLGYDPSRGCDTLYCWDTSRSAVADSRSYLSARHTALQPDLAGLVACREIADELSRKYGVQILLWTDATSYEPWDYTLIPEYQVPVIRRNLRQLEDFLSMYPAGFLEKAAELTSSGRIQICLVRDIIGKDDAPGAVSDAVGLQYWDHNRNSYLCLQVQHGELVSNACHEMSHIIDSRVLTFCRAYDDWNSLNPKGFQYRGTDLWTPDQQQQLWLDDATRVFIDSYSMTYPKEDRARIMEFAMADNAQHYFQSETMQKKLRQICLGIREAFNLKKSTEIFRWEQYLDTPLTKK